MPLRLPANAGAQTTIALPLASGATSFVGGSTAGFPVPQSFGSAAARLTILDAGNAGWNANAPLATPFEYASYTSNNTGTNTLSGLTRGEASTTAKNFSAGAIVAVGWLAEDLIASVPWKFEEQTVSAVSAVTIPASGTIPASYLGINWRHLEIRYRLRTSAAPNGTASLYMQFNGDASGNYAWAQLFNTPPSSAGYNEQFAQTWIGIGLLPQGGATAGMFGQGEIKIEDYAAAQIKKARGWTDGSFGLGTPGLQFALRHGFWNGTGALTTIRLFPSDGSTVTGEVTTYLTP
jgi:hypothetical protein